MERNNGISKLILGRISREITISFPNTLVSLTSILENIFHESSIRSSFQIVRGYASSIARDFASAVPREVLDAHNQLTARRACQKALESTEPQVLTADLLPEGTNL